MRILMVLICCVLCARAQWSIDTVETGISNYSKSYLVLNPSNEPHIAYLPCYTTSLMYAKWESNAWQVMTVASDAYTTAGGPTLALSLALSDGFLPYITYTASPGSSQRLKVAAYNGVDWDTLYVDGTQIAKASLVLIDSGGPPCIGYQYLNLQKFAIYQVGSWLYDTIGEGTYPTGKVSLCLDNTGVYHYAYDINTHIIYARGGITNWVLDTVDQGVYTSMKLDEDRMPHLVYTKPNNTDLWYAFFNGANWITTLVDTGCGTGPRLIAPSMDLDSAEQVHVCYLQQTSTSGVYRLKYALYNGSVWYFEVVDQGFAWHVPSLAVTESGSVHISYFNGSALLHAYRDPVGVVEEKPITGNGGAEVKAFAMPNPFVSYTTVPGFERMSFQVYDITGALLGTYYGYCIGADLNPGVYFVACRDKSAGPLRAVKLK